MSRARNRIARPKKKSSQKPLQQQPLITSHDRIETRLPPISGPDANLPADSDSAQVKAMQSVVGNRTVQRMLHAGKGSNSSGIVQLVEGGNWVREHEMASAAAARSAAEGEKKVHGDMEEFQGYYMRPDAAQLEKVLKAVISNKGFRGAQNFVMDYKFRAGISRKQLDLREKIWPILDSKLDELGARGRDYAEKTFYPNAVAYLNKILDDSEKTIINEGVKYGFHRDESGEYIISETADTAGLEAAARTILERYNKLEALNQRLQSYEEREEIFTSEESGMRLIRRSTGKFNVKITDPAAHKQVSEEIKTAQGEMMQVRSGYEAKYPILASFRPPEGLSKLKDLAGGDKEERSKTVVNDLVEKYHNILEIRKVANDNKFIWKQPTLIGGAKNALGVQPGSVEDKGIDAKIDAVAVDERLRNLGLGLIGLLGAALAAIPTGGGSLAAYAAVGAGIGVTVASGGISIYESIQEYQVQKAATGTAFDKAQAISQEDPSLFWLAFDIVTAVADVGDAARSFIKAARAIRAIRKLEKLEDMAREAYRNAGLAWIMSEDEFVEHFMRNMKGQVESLGAASKARSALMDKLTKSEHPNMAALISGDETAMVGLLREHGRWEFLIADLKAGTDEMQKIADKLVSYRKREVIDKLDSLFGAKLSEKAGTQPTSDLDFSLASDSLGGAGEKLMKAETYMTNKFGQGWEELWRVNFYADMKSRLLATEEVLPMMNESEKAALLYKQHELSTKYNLSRQLQYASSDPEAIARIEKNARDLGMNLEEIRKLANTGEDAARAQRNALLLKVDELEAAYRAASGREKVDLAKKIQELQMEANFYTREAVISPGAAGELLQEGSARGLQIADAMMEWKTLLQHSVAEYGSVGEAMRHYETWKYIKRQVDFALKKELEPGLKSYLELLKERGEYIYEFRDWAAEASHLGGTKALEAKNIELYRDFLNDMTSIAKNIRDDSLREMTREQWTRYMQLLGISM